MNQFSPGDLVEICSLGSTDNRYMYFVEYEDTNKDVNSSNDSRIIGLPNKTLGFIMQSIGNYFSVSNNLYYVVFVDNKYLVVADKYLTKM